jgi:exodeoxyribonuclease VII large subunit
VNSTSIPPASNQPVYSVSEISLAIKRTLEGTFDYVRVRGEISGFKRAASGHLYMALKDHDGVLDAVCWRGNAGRLGLAPEDGMEVIASGRITSYPGRSKYQIVIERLELAGQGALLKLLEDRKRKLEAEGLFDAARKRALPFLPECIGVVTSPTGAVIRDILHRLEDRFPRRVLVWPVPVQGEGAAEQVAAAIAGFNALPADQGVPRPDVLIVARGGGSLEDLWAFNEEVVVRAAAASQIPLISAVGHETDVTLIDFAADRRAPTPTAAAEMAVPVRAELIAQVEDAGRRLRSCTRQRLAERKTLLEGLARGLPDPARLLEEKAQRLDDRAERLRNCAHRALSLRQERVRDLGARLPPPQRQIDLARERLKTLAERLRPTVTRQRTQCRERFLGIDERFRMLLGPPTPPLIAARQKLEVLARVLDTADHKKVLQRGFALVRGPKGVITRAAAVTPGLAMQIQFDDGQVPVTADKGVRSGVAPEPKRRAPVKSKNPQGSLL